MTALGSVVVQTAVLLTGLVVVQGDTQVGCVFGESCVLPCRFQPNSDTILHWVRISGKKVLVHSYYDDQDQLGDQDPLYKGRTSLFHDQISRGKATLGLAREYLDNATVVSDKPKLFPDHVTTQEYLDNANVVSDKPKLFPDHVTTQEYLDNATVVSDKPKLFPDHVTTQKYRDQRMRLHQPC
ncbi:unnamed protein product [Boreogadus saida]